VKALVSITLCPVDSIRCPVRVKFLKKLVLIIMAKMTTQMNILILQKVKIILDVISFCVWCMLSSCSGRVM